MTVQHRQTSRRGPLGALLCLSTLGALLIGSSMPQGGTPADAAPRPNTRWIVRTTSPDTLSRAQAQARTADHKVQHRFTRVFPGMAVTMDEGSAARMRTMPGVVSVTPDTPIHAAGTQNNPPIGLDRIDQVSPRPSRSFSAVHTGAGVTAYVVDSGLNLSHTDFTGRVIQGPNYEEPGTPPTDCAGHGTHVAGTLAGTRFGVAKKATVVPIKVLDCTGGGFTSNMIAALDWAVGHHRAGTPAVLNMSVGGASNSEMTTAVRAAVADGITVVAAAGNAEEGQAPVDACTISPASTPEAITVANASVDNRQAPDSNHGKCVDLYAPGTGIRSAWVGSSTATMVDSGTSMAAPHVAGAAALLLQARPSWTPAQVGTQLVVQSQKNVVMKATPGTPNRMLQTVSSITPAR